MADEKKTVELPGAGPDTRKTVEVVTLPIVLQEVRDLRREGRERGAKTDDLFKNLALQVQQNHEQHGGKIRSLEEKHETMEQRATSLERRAGVLEREAKDLKGQVSQLRGDTTKQVSLTEEEMAKKLEAEAEERGLLNDRIGPVETKVDMLSTMLVQSFGLHPPVPVIPNPDGSLPPPSSDSKRPKNAIQKQTFWTRIAAVMGGLVVIAETLDKMGVFDAFKKH